jgi:arylsulfatase A-like enzyme
MLALLLGVCTLPLAAGAPPPPPRPKVILTVLLDDFGYASASFNRDPATAPPETRTPHLDALARDGLVLRRHYVHPFCSPSRASFLSGRLPVHVQQTNAQPDQPNCGIPYAMSTLPELLRAAGAPVDAYALGKYDMGAAHARHTPEGRGFNGSLVYFSHAIDAFTQTDYCGPAASGGACTCGDRFTDLWDSGAPAAALNGTGYADDLFLARALHLIASHDYASGRTLWLHYCPHATHDPLQATPAMLAPLAGTSNDESLCNASVAASATGAVYPGAPTAPAGYACRRTYEAMAQWADGALGALRSALEAAGAWEGTFLWLSSDNGGQGDLEFGGGSNYPLRGGKGGFFEGGVRVAAVVSGGLLPPARRGSVEAGMVHVADALATVCGLLGAGSACASDARGAAAGLPPLDSLDQWPLLSGANGTSPRQEVPLGAGALVTPQWKLLLGRQAVAGWHGPLFPNASSPANDPHAQALECGAGGCLFDVAGDAGEHEDVAAAHPGVAAALAARLAALRGGFFSNNDSEALFECAHNASLSVNGECACDLAARGGGFFRGGWARLRG